MTEPTNETSPLDGIDQIDLGDVAALAMAIAIWLGNKYPESLNEIGNMADILKEQFVAGE